MDVQQLHPAAVPTPSAPSHRQKPARSASVASASSSRSAALRDTKQEPQHAHPRGTPPPATSASASARRRSSAANGAAHGLAAFRDSHRPAKDQGLHHHHVPHPSFSRKLTLTTLGPVASLNGTPAPASPKSPRRPNRPPSPLYGSPSSVTATPQLPALPPMLLPATVYDPNTPPSASTANTPPATNPSSSSLLSGNPPRDYFTSKSLTVGPTPPSRSKADRVLGRSPLASPAIIGLQEGDQRHDSASETGPRFSSAAPKDHLQKPLQSAGLRQPAPRQLSTSQSRDHIRSQSRDHATSQSRDHARSASRDHHQSDSRDPQRDPSRNHFRGDSTTSTRLDDDLHQGTPPRTRERREQDKKTMLSRALQKANTAVLLDNAQNFEGAMEAYEDACGLLQQVMLRSSQEEDRRKLDAIRVTYTNRIEELRRLDPGYPNHGGKSLPPRPMSGDSLAEQRSMLQMDDDDDDDDDPAVIQTAAMTRIVNDSSLDNPPFKAEPEPPPANQLPFRKPETGPARESVISTAIRDVQRGLQTSQFQLQPPPMRNANPLDPPQNTSLEPLMDRSYMPPPLTPLRSKSPLFNGAKEIMPEEQNDSLQPQPQPQPQPKHQRSHSNESTSWLDTIDESGGSSCSSSVHSISLGGIRRKHIRATSGGTEAEFDAALDAAVEAAYDEGYEPYDDVSARGDLISTKLRNVELAKERVREAEREEMIAAAKYHHKETQLRNEALPHVRESAELRFNAEAEEEERLLDEMTKEYMLDGFDFDLQTKSSLPRQSDSSNFSGSTYNSSVSSHRTTGGTSLSTVVEVMHPPNKSQSLHSTPAAPAPSGALPALPPLPESQTAPMDETAEVTPQPSSTLKEAASVRNRRLSGQPVKTLKIETSLPAVPAAPHTEKPPVPAKDSPTDVPVPPKSAAAASFATLPGDSAFKLPPLPHHSSLVAPSPGSLFPSSADTTPATPAMNYSIPESGLVPGSPKTGKNSALGIRKNKSSMSLRARNLSVSSPDGSDASVGTPLSQTFSMTGRKPSNTGLPLATPTIPMFNVDGLPSGGMHLFESDIHSPTMSPGSPSPAVANAPIPLEPCPDSYLLRPFWLMRCFYQTIAHPRGGYLSTKLFIPRDVWRVKGVKLKNVEDKIACCDLLTAALQKLASVDTFDADAILEEMQALELVLDQVQVTLAKKLGNEVGVQSVSSLFKDATTVGEGVASVDGSGKGSHSSQDHAPKSAVLQGKSYLASWRKLRSKNSGINLVGMTGNKGAEVPKDSLVMTTLPMTNLSTIKFAKRDINSVVCEGPNSNYMGSLARLFDSAQILDQVARQVEDPGLKHSSPTHVGLELSSRHAAEFFGFYICRFVLADITMMLDKFIKRGSEWVLV